MQVYSCIAKALILAALASALTLAGCGGGGGSAPPAATLQSIAVTPQNQTPALNSRLQLVATGTYSDNSTQNITTTVTWSSSNTAVATVGATTGLVTPVVGAAASQSTVITASSGTLSGTTTVTLAAIPTFTLDSVADPLVSQQWGLRNTGQNGYADTAGIANAGGALGTDINANPVYSAYGYTGWGITVAVIDSGLEIAHEDLGANVVSGGSWNFINSTTNPTSTSTSGDHGTSVSGLIAMARNGIGGIGVAPNVQLKGFNYLGDASVQTLANGLVSLGGSTSSPNSSDVTIFNQSFGTSSNVDFQITPEIEAQYAYGTTSLRGGKGALYVKSAGNGFAGFGSGPDAGYCVGANLIGISCQNANFDPGNTLPYNIVVAALNAKGQKSSYSTAGSAIWASTPGGEYGMNTAVVSGLSAVSYDPAMVTTDQSNCLTGYSETASASSLFNRGGTNLASINSGCNYTNGFNGTSSAAPMMSGAIALILEANPALGWREVKDILARTAVQVDAGVAAVSVPLGTGGSHVAEQGWITNAAGFNFHNWYGFGAVDAAAAVALARTYTSGTLGIFASTGWISSGTLSLAIADDNTAGAIRQLVVPLVGTGGIVESVQLQVTTALTPPSTSGWTGDLGIELTSPSGTKSILKNIRDGFTGNTLNGMVLASNAFYGESGTGTWTVRVVDGWSGFTQTLTNVQIRVYGH